MDVPYLLEANLNAGHVLSSPLTDTEVPTGGGTRLLPLPLPLQDAPLPLGAASLVSALSMHAHHLADHCSHLAWERHDKHDDTYLTSMYLPLTTDQ